MKHHTVDSFVDMPLTELSEQALQWLVDLHSGTATDADWNEYALWCETSPDHQRAADMAEHVWQRLGSALERPSARSLRHSVLGLLLILSMTAGLYWQNEKHGWMADQVTAVGERRTLILDDGSQLALAPNTRVDIKFNAKRRVLRLYAGELFVQVAQDAMLRPFEVEAGAGRMRALGTEFDVRRYDDTVSLVVVEHSVRVITQNNLQAINVEAGQSIEYDSLRISSPQSVDVSDSTAWRRDQLVFNQQPLSEVLEQIGRYHRGLIWVRDRDLKALLVTGVVATGDTDAQLQLLQDTLPLRIRQLPWLTVVERSRGEK